jgi:Protein of unknown function (DUF3309)
VLALGSLEELQTGGRKQMLMFILMIFVIIAMIASLPIWPHSKNWSFYPIGGVSLVLVIILILLFARR